MGSLTRGFEAGLRSGGRYSGLGSGLKKVLENMKYNQGLKTRVGLQGMRDRGAMARTMVGRGLNPSTGAPIQQLPADMQEAGYRLYGGKPYKTKSIAYQYPGEREAMGLAYMQYMYENLKDTDPALAAQIKTRMSNQRRDMARDMLGDPTVGTVQPEIGGGELSVMDKAKNMLGTAGNFVKDLYTGE